jgi:hypothetical protein
MNTTCRFFALLHGQDGHVDGRRSESGSLRAGRVGFRRSTGTRIRNAALETGLANPLDDAIFRRTSRSSKKLRSSARFHSTSTGSE